MFQSYIVFAFRFSLRACLFLMVPFVLIACTRIAMPGVTNSAIIDNPAALNGSYNNLSTDTSTQASSLWVSLTRKAGRVSSPGDPSKKKATVKLVALGKHKINAQLFVNGLMADESILRGRIVDSHSFSLKQRTANLGVPLIYMKLNRYRARLRLNNEKELLEDVADSHGKMVFLFSGGNTEDKTFFYSRQ